jgi:hypothetical protein
MSGSLPVAVFYSLFVDYYVSSLTGAMKEQADRYANRALRRGVTQLRKARSLSGTGFRSAYTI